MAITGNSILTLGPLGCIISTSRRRISGLLIVVLMLQIMRSTSWVWYEERPDTRNPCTHVVVGPLPGAIASVHPSPNCSTGGVMWYATFGRIHVHLDMQDGKDFLLCLTSGSTNKIYVWWATAKDSWSPISFQLSFDFVPRRDMCRVSRNGIMDLYLEPPWAEIFYESYVMWNITRGLSPEEAAATASSIAADGLKPDPVEAESESESSYE